VFYVFDLLILAGEDLTNEPLGLRRKLLHTRVMSRLAEPIRFSETIRASAAVIRAVREQGLEGVIAKRRDSSYQPGKRSGAWVKMRVNQGQELVIGGYMPARNNFDSIVVGYYEGKKLIYESWYPERGQPEVTFTIVTCAVNAEIAEVHDRMPVVLDERRRRTG
jgi:bifunctional non-homologous end joining protein LigD